MKNNVKNIAYLAPEIPGFSSTFVYNEIFALENQGFTITPFSVHRAGSFESEPKLKNLAERTTYLYEQSLLSLILVNIGFFIKNPLVYLCKLCLCISDMFSLLSQPTIALGLFYRFLVAASLADKLKRANVSHIHMHFAHVPTDIGMYAAGLAGITYSLTAHANDIFERGWLLKRKVSRSKFFATISNFNIDWLVRLGADRNKLGVVRCGVDSEQFNLREQKPKSSPVTFGFLGRLVEKKGTHILIDACAQLNEDSDDFVIQIVGDGPLEQELKTQALDKGVAEKVLFLGAKPHSEISHWLESLDYFVLPCVKDAQGDMDGIPVALMEAMLKGVPVISTDISGIPELVIGDDTGLSANNNDVNHLATILRQACAESNDITLDRVEKAEQLVRLEYDLKSNAKRLGNLITAE
ncbi:MAG: glycosyltransferase [Cellvibrionaceae bacterium]